MGGMAHTEVKQTVMIISRSTEIAENYPMEMKQL